MIDDSAGINIGQILQGELLVFGFERDPGSQSLFKIQPLGAIADRHGLIWLERGELCVVDGCLNFSSGKQSPAPHNLQVPHQAISMILLGPSCRSSNNLRRSVGPILDQQTGYLAESRSFVPALRRRSMRAWQSADQAPSILP